MRGRWVWRSVQSCAHSLQRKNNHCIKAFLLKRPCVFTVFFKPNALFFLLLWWLMRSGYVLGWYYCFGVRCCVRVQSHTWRVCSTIYTIDYPRIHALDCETIAQSACISMAIRAGKQGYTYAVNRRYDAVTSTCSSLCISNIHNQDKSSQTAKAVWVTLGGILMCTMVVQPAVEPHILHQLLDWKSTGGQITTMLRAVDLPTAAAMRKTAHEQQIWTQDLQYNYCKTFWNVFSL